MMKTHDLTLIIFYLQLTHNDIKRCIDSENEFRSVYRLNFDKKSNADEES